MTSDWLIVGTLVALAVAVVALGRVAWRRRRAPGTAHDFQALCERIPLSVNSDAEYHEAWKFVVELRERDRQGVALNWEEMRYLGELERCALQYHKLHPRLDYHPVWHDERMKELAHILGIVYQCEELMRREQTVNAEAAELIRDSRALVERSMKQLSADYPLDGDGARLTLKLELEVMPARLAQGLFNAKAALSMLTDQPMRQRVGATVRRLIELSGTEECGFTIDVALEMAVKHALALGSANSADFRNAILARALWMMSRAEYRTAIALLNPNGSNDAGVLCTLAQCHARLGELRTARRYLSKVKRLPSLDHVDLADLFGATLVYIDACLAAFKLSAAQTGIDWAWEICREGREWPAFPVRYGRVLERQVVLCCNLGRWGEALGTYDRMGTFGNPTTVDRRENLLLFAALNRRFDRSTQGAALEALAAERRDALPWPLGRYADLLRQTVLSRMAKVA